MKISMYQASVPVFIRMLGNLRGILQKASAHAEAKKLDPATLPNCRLYPDMFTLIRQVQAVSDIAKSCPARLAGMDPPKFEDNESTFPELLARVDKTLAYVKTFKAEQLDGAEDKAIVVHTPRGPLNFVGLPYLLHFVLPNFHFHVTTAYDILRHNGVELGKMDYLGSG